MEFDETNIQMHTYVRTYTLYCKLIDVHLLFLFSLAAENRNTITRARCCQESCSVQRVSMTTGRVYRWCFNSTERTDR